MNASTIVSSSSSSSSSCVPMQLDLAESAGTVSKTSSVAQRTFHIAGKPEHRDRFVKRSSEHISSQKADIVFQLELKNNKILRVPEYFLTNPEDVLKENIFDLTLRFSNNAQIVQKGRKRPASPNAEIPPSKKGPEQQPLIPFALPDYQEKTIQAWINYRLGNDQDLTPSDEELKELHKYSDYIQEPGLSRLALSFLTQLPNVEDHAEFLLRELVEKDWALDTSANEYQHFENFLTNVSVWQHVLSPDFTQWLNQKVESHPIAACILAIFYNKSQNDAAGPSPLELARKAGGHSLGTALQALYLPLEQKQERLNLAGRALEQKSLYGGFVLAFINDSVPEHVRTAAEKGLTDAMGWLALSYFEGKRGLAQNESLAFEWWSKAAEKGDAEALYKISRRYSSGNGVPKDEAKALELLIKAAKKENPSAMHKLGICYFKGTGGVSKQDKPQAFQWLSKAAAKGYPEAMNDIGYCYSIGIIDVVPQDAAQAFQWWSKAAEKEDLNAMCSLGDCYAYGSSVSKNESQAFQLWHKAARKGHLNSTYRMALCYLNSIGASKNEPLAIQWLNAAAERGHLGAMYSLSVCYSEGIGVTKDEALAIQWLSKAAENKYPEALSLQALRNFSGSNGAPPNIPEAINLWTKAKDNEAALYWLGYCYFTGTGVIGSRRRAVELWKKAAERGYPDAMLWLANCYKSGMGIEQNEAQAAHWSQMAAKQELKKRLFPRV